MPIPVLAALGAAASRAAAGELLEEAGEVLGGIRGAGILSRMTEFEVDASELSDAASAAAKAATPHIRITFHANRVNGFMKGIQRQLRFAAARTLNDTAFAIRAEEQSAIYQQIDRPTPFTVRGFQVQKARAETLHARVFIEEKRWKYMQYQVEGGTRRKKAKALMIGATPRNEYGNIPGWNKKWATYLQRYGRENLKSGKLGGLAGLWVKKKRLSSNQDVLSRQSNAASRAGRRWELLIVYKDAVSYRERFFFYRNAEPVISRFVQLAWREHLTAAIETATIK